MHGFRQTNFAVFLNVVSAICNKKFDCIESLTFEYFFTLKLHDVNSGHETRQYNLILISKSNLDKILKLTKSNVPIENMFKSTMRCNNVCLVFFD